MNDKDLRERHERLVNELAEVAEALRDLDLDPAPGESIPDCAARHLRADQKRDLALRAQIGLAAGMVTRHPPFSWEELIARVYRLDKRRDALLAFARDMLGDLMNVSEDVWNAAMKHGLLMREVYDIEKHGPEFGDDTGSEPGDAIWVRNAEILGPEGEGGGQP